MSAPAAGGARLGRSAGAAGCGQCRTAVDRSLRRSGPGVGTPPGRRRLGSAA